MDEWMRMGGGVRGAGMHAGTGHGECGGLGGVWWGGGVSLVGVTPLELDLGSLAQGMSEPASNANAKKESTRAQARPPTPHTHAFSPPPFHVSRRTCTPCFQPSRGSFCLGSGVVCLPLGHTATQHVRHPPTATAQRRPGPCPKFISCPPHPPTATVASKRASFAS